MIQRPRGVRDSRHQGATDFAYQLHLHDPDAHQALVADLREIPGTQDVNLFVHNEHEEI